jgi:adenosine deaminase
MINPSLPLLDLHRHLDGNIRSQTILELGQQFNIDMPADNLESLRPFVQIIDNEPDLLGFLNKLDWGVKVLGDLDVCKRIAYENMLDAAEQGLDYIELRFSPYYMAQSHQLNVADVVAAVIDGIQAGSKEVPVKAKLIGILSRTFGVEACQTELNGLLAHKQHLIALDLAGDELGFPGNLFESHFKQARDAGLNITVHAGEAAGSESIWHAIKQLGATRIGHGVKAIEDNLLLDYLRDNQIGIESCLTSNIQTSTVASLATHPLKRFLDHGILATINTDDPGVSNIEISHEFEVAAPKAGLTPTDIRQAQENALCIAFLTDSERKELLTSFSARN